MSWQEIEEAKITDDESLKNKKQEIENLAKLYHRVFKTPDGERLLADMTNRFVVNNHVPLEHPNVQYAAAYKNGESGVVQFIIRQLSIAESL